MPPSQERRLGTYPILKPLSCHPAPNGSKLWRFNYRFLDKQKKLHLGGWPTISLAEARARRDEAKKKIAEGIDPALEKKRARIAAKYAAANTFQAVAEES